MNKWVRDSKEASTPFRSREDRSPFSQVISGFRLHGFSCLWASSWISWRRIPTIETCFLQRWFFCGFRQDCTFRQHGFRKTGLHFRASSFLPSWWHWRRLVKILHCRILPSLSKLRQFFWIQCTKVETATWTWVEMFLCAHFESNYLSCTNKMLRVVMGPMFAGKTS